MLTDKLKDYVGNDIIIDKEGLRVASEDVRMKREPVPSEGVSKTTPLII